MYSNFIVSSISIWADLSFIQKILTEYKYIHKWERGLNSWKELHVSEDKMSITYWDIEDGIDYVFHLTEMYDCIQVRLKIGDLSNRFNDLDTIQKAQKYLDTVMNRIKELSEDVRSINV
ncbi:hypothetical protein [Sphingobacterium hungaricum]|uniref:Uncharacterized protein n=1 Tax=Sphingobacterium hungaricum TaxID=2082723 RepID=A0A928YNH9_9SPHI|nr:hypothetical protein [Sphingobacterium hungaricum]MBE8712076.1 hypothetical protein [Sphingobacterium hungaricum]